MLYKDISPVHRFGDYFVKREDLACWTDLNNPSGSKVRQYLTMAQMGMTALEWEAKGRPNPPPMIVGCSADSAMQIYVASAAKLLNTKGIIYTAKRNKRSAATNYALEMGAEVVEIRPAHLSVVRARARSRMNLLGPVVKWNKESAIADAARQTVNIPREVKRIIVATGSGLTAEGVILGLIANLNLLPVLVVKSSIMRVTTRLYDDITIVEPTTPYQQPVIERLPDGTPLDPFYSAKAWKYMRPGDMLWPPGLRPIRSMPEECVKEFKDWKGPEQ